MDGILLMMTWLRTVTSIPVFNKVPEKTQGKLPFWTVELLECSNTLNALETADLRVCIHANSLDEVKREMSLFNESVLDLESFDNAVSWDAEAGWFSWIYDNMFEKERYALHGSLTYSI